jgi:hypothetical protein
MKYDDASWHYGGDFPTDLPQEAGATHIGMFVAWALLSGLGGEIHTEDFPEDVPSLESRKLTPGAFFIASCDGKFTDEDLNEEGNAFANDYFENGPYISDYEAVVGAGLPSLYHAEDSWGNFERVKHSIDQRLQAWRATRG